MMQDSSSQSQVSPSHLVGALAMILARSASLSTTSILFSTASTALHALVHCSSPVPASLSFRSLVSLADVLEVPKPMTDMLGRAGIADAIPGRRIE
jgi:hypothetical protein